MNDLIRLERGTATAEEIAALTVALFSAISAAPARNAPVVQLASWRPGPSTPAARSWRGAA